MGDSQKAHERSGRSIALIAVCLLVSSAFSQKTPPPARSAQSYPAVDVHAQEKVSVAADPLDTHEKESFFKIDYLKAGFMPVQLIITNDSDSAIKLDQVRAYFVTAEGDKLRAADEDAIARRTTDLKDPNKRMGAPPIVNRLTRPKSKYPKIDEDFQAADFADLTVAPHSTQSGYLFFDMNDVTADPPLAGAKLLVRGIETADGTQLFYFEAPFDKYLAEKQK